MLALRHNDQYPARLAGYHAAGRSKAKGLLMLFPKTIFVKQNNFLDQLDHLQSEIEEVREAFAQGDFDAAADELVDVQQSADTGLHILLEQHEATSHDAYTRVSVKNAARGYYAAPGPPSREVGDPEEIMS